MKLTLDHAVRELRRRLRLTQQELAVKLGLAVRTVSVYETGKSKGNFQVIKQLGELAAVADYQDLARVFNDIVCFPWGGALMDQVQSLSAQLEDLKAENAALRHELEVRNYEGAQSSQHRSYPQGLVHPI